jgi:hypothetical protein
MKQGDLAGSLEATSDGLQASDLSRAMVAGLAAVISWNQLASHIYRVQQEAHEGNDPTVIASLSCLLQCLLDSIIPSHFAS